MVDRPFRILHVIDTMDTGGAQRHLASLADALNSRGHECLIATSGSLCREGNVASVTLTRESISRRVPLRFTARLARLLAEWAPDIVHAHLHSSSLAAAAAVVVHRVPVVVTHHSDWAWQRAHDRTLGRWASGRAHSVIAVAHSLAAGLSGRRVPAVTIPNGVPLQEVGDRDPCIRARLRLPQDAFVVGFTGRFTEDKDPLLFVDMAARVAAGSPHARFLMVGDGPLRGAVEERIRRHGLTGQVLCTGFRQDVEALYEAADVLVLPSRRDACPLVLLEAMAARRPVVSTPVGDVPRIIGDRAGVVVPSADADGLAGAVLTLADRERREEMGREARNRVAERYSLARMVDRTIEVYENVLLRQK
jgi:glycosyltransferase involved in cell wall biosynthesis